MIRGCSAAELEATGVRPGDVVTSGRHDWRVVTVAHMWPDRTPFRPRRSHIVVVIEPVRPTRLQRSRVLLGRHALPLDRFLQSFRGAA